MTDFTTSLDSFESFSAMRAPSQVFHFKNIIPIPDLLIKTFSLDDTAPYTVAKAFFDAMFEFDNEVGSNSTTQAPLSEPALLDESGEERTDEIDVHSNPDSPAPIQGPNQASPNPKFLDSLIHVIQFCHLCYKGKVTPVHYSMATTPEIDNWFASLTSIKKNNGISKAKRAQPLSDVSSDSESGIDSPDQKISRKDSYILSTVLKLHDSLDKSNQKNSQEKADKEPGFHRLETHRKNLILNASACPPYDSPAQGPNEFYKSFLAKKSQFKAKEMISHRFYLDKIAFNPNSAFVANLWNCDFFWILPDSPSGVSIFFCPETKSMNAAELEN